MWGVQFECVINYELSWSVCVFSWRGRVCKCGVGVCVQLES